MPAGLPWPQRCQVLCPQRLEGLSGHFPGFSRCSLSTPPAGAVASMALPPSGSSGTCRCVSGCSACVVLSFTKVSALVAAVSHTAAFPDPLSHPSSLQHRGHCCRAPARPSGTVSSSEPGWRLQGAALRATRPSSQAPPASSGSPPTSLKGMGVTGQLEGRHSVGARNPERPGRSSLNKGQKRRPWCSQTVQSVPSEK